MNTKIHVRMKTEDKKKNPHVSKNIKKKTQEHSLYACSKVLKHFSINETVNNSKHEVCIILQDHCKQRQQITLIRIFGSRHDIQRQKSNAKLS